MLQAKKNFGFIYRRISEPDRQPAVRNMKYRLVANPASSRGRLGCDEVCAYVNAHMAHDAYET